MRRLKFFNMKIKKFKITRNTYDTTVSLDLYLNERARLDKFWQHKAVKFDFTADLTVIGNRS